MDGINNTLFTTTGITDSERILHTPENFTKKALLYVQEAGKLKSLKPHRSEREKLDSFLFLCVVDGEGTVTVGREIYKVKKGNCALIDCMEYYAHESSGDNPWQLMWVHFNGNIAKHYYKLFLESNENRNIFELDDDREVKEMIDGLIEYQKRKDLVSELLTGESLLHLVNYCIFATMRKEKHENSRMVCNEIREDVNERYQDADLIELLERKYSLSGRELDDKFKDTYGITLRGYILNRRFTAAKELLRFTVKPIDAIIKESGIGNEELFRNLFENDEGMTAEEYRMKWSQWVK